MQPGQLNARRVEIMDAVERHGIVEVRVLVPSDEAPLPGGLDAYMLVRFDEDRRPAGLAYLKELLAIEDELCALLGHRVGVGDAMGTSNWILFDHRAREEARPL